MLGSSAEGGPPVPSRLREALTNPYLLPAQACGRARERKYAVLRPRRSVVGLLAASILLALSLVGCASEPTGTSSPVSTTEQTAQPDSAGKGVKTIYVAGGCFWGVEKYIGLVNGVVDTEAGYANGANDSAKYGDGSGYAEAVRVDYDPAVAPLPFLLDLFYDAIEPTSVNRQGNDVGTEYRAGIYYTDPADEAVIEQSLARLQKEYTQPIAVESGPLTSYTRAEEYHQDYLKKDPGGYCHIPQKLFDAAAAARPE